MKTKRSELIVGKKYFLGDNQTTIAKYKGEFTECIGFQIIEWGDGRFLEDRNIDSDSFGLVIFCAPGEGFDDDHNGFQQVD
jgi:hypothetical protein